jgi:acyl-CoA thioesterase-1
VQNPLVVIGIIALALALVAVPTVLWVRYLTRRRTLWAGILTDRVPENAAWWKAERAREGELLYVAIGDSAAQGIGASLPRRSYVGLIARHVRERTGSTVRVVNLSISGATVGLALERQMPRLARLEPDLVTVSIGANDIANFDLPRFEAQMRELFAQLPPATIVADLPTFYFLPAEKHVRAANRVLRSVAAEHGLVVVPLHARMRRQGLWGVSTQFAGDLFHPNDRGYRVWASAFLPQVDRVLDDRIGGRA